MKHFIASAKYISTYTCLNSWFGDFLPFQQDSCLEFTTVQKSCHVYKPWGQEIQRTVSWSYLRENSHVICFNVLWSKNSIIVTICINLYIYILITLGAIKIIKSNILYFESLKLNRASLSKSSLIYTLFSSKIHKGTLCIISVIMT